MRYVTGAFAGEGPTDYRFVLPLVQRHLETLVAARAAEEVGIGPLQPITRGGRPTNQCEVVVEQFVRGEVFADILFVHTDAGTSLKDALETRVEPLRDALGCVDGAPAVVGVVPDRETEAWMLADLAALERVLGVKSGLLREVEPPRRLHRVLDPKAALRQLVDGVVSPGARRRSTRRHTDRLDRIYNALALEIDLDVLRCAPSFVAYEVGLLEALKARKLIR